MGKTLLHMVLDYEKDVAPYRFVQIYSGVGSGKNLWVQKLVEDGSHVLLITSRQITADAQDKKLDASRWINLDQLLDVDEREFEFLYSDIVHTSSARTQVLKNLCAIIFRSMTLERIYGTNLTTSYSMKPTPYPPTLHFPMRHFM